MVGLHMRVLACPLSSVTWICAVTYDDGGWPPFCLKFSFSSHMLLCIFCRRLFRQIHWALSGLQACPRRRHHWKSPYPRPFPWQPRSPVHMRPAASRTPSWCPLHTMRTLSAWPLATPRASHSQTRPLWTLPWDSALSRGPCRDCRRPREAYWVIITTLRRRRQRTAPPARALFRAPTCCTDKTSRQ